MAIDTSNQHEIAIRPLSDGDEVGAANAHIHCWRETYTGLIHDEFLDSLPVTMNRRIEFWRGIATEMASGSVSSMVATENFNVVGFVILGAARDHAFSDCGELQALYLLRHYQKKKIGFLLFCAGIRQLRELGFRSAYAWVLSGNPAVEFYIRTGAKLCGNQKTVYIGDRCYEELALRWESIGHLE